MCWCQCLQNWMADYLGYTLRTKTLFSGWPILLWFMTRIREEEKVPSEGQNLSANQISLTYLHSRLRYYYFRFGKRTSAIFYFRFPFRPFSRNLHVILHQAIKFCRNRSTHCGNDIISIYQVGGRSILLPVSYLLMTLPSEGQSLSANQISSTYLNSLLRYSYFRFWKTNVSHIGILLPVEISTIFFVICIRLLCIRLPNFVQIGAPIAQIWRHIHFSR